MKKSELKARAARYTKTVEWSDEDGCFVGSAPPLIGPCCHGKDEARVYAQLCGIVEEWIALSADETSADAVGTTALPGKPLLIGVHRFTVG
jgi:predicted RNase H-like HicB family nuclease